MPRPKFNTQALKEAKSIIKFPEIIFGSVCVLLLDQGCFWNDHEMAFAFTTFTAYLIISPSILLVSLITPVQQNAKPYLELFLTVTGSILYSVVAGLTLDVTQSYSGSDHCFKSTTILAIFVVLNVLAYSCDVFFVLQLVYTCPMRRKPEIDILERF